MTRNSRILKTATVTLALSVSAANAQTVFVDAAATDMPHDGSTWCNAFLTLQDALAVAVSGDTARVAEGTYMPDGGYTPIGGAHVAGSGDRTATFQLINGVAIEGGYAGCGAPDPDERDLILHETTLSGDLNGDDAEVSCTEDSQCDSNGNLCVDLVCMIKGNNTENSYHVVTAGSGIISSAVLDGFTITAGNADGPSDSHGGGMYNFFGSPTVANCTFNQNSANNRGGGMFNGISNPTVTNCTFSGNAGGDGGGMHNLDSNPAVTGCTFSGNANVGMLNTTGSSPMVTNCTFTGNSGSSGGGMSCNNGSNPTVTDCTFSGNSAGSPGGGMHINASSPTVTNCTFSENSAGDRGGGIAVDNSHNLLKVTNCTFTGNSAGRGGGMHIIQSTNPSVTGCTFIGNSAISDGGGMRILVDSSPTVTDCTFNGNSANNEGGGMHINASSPTVTDCTFTQNTASFGGGMCNFSNSNPTVTNCMFSGNSANSNGGGMHNKLSASPTVTGCTFSGNSANSNGGGMHNEFLASPGVINCTFSGNRANDDGGGMYTSDSSPTVTNSILWDNVDDADGDGGGPFMDESAQIHVDSGTLVINHSIVEGWTGALGGTGNTGNDPLFIDADGPDDIPGTDDDDLRLQAGSSGIDAGDNTAVPPDVADLDGDGDTDERTPLDLDGNPRFVDDPGILDTGVPDPPDYPDIVDKGAYEFPGAGEPIPTVSEWGIIVMTLLLLSAGTVVFPARRTETASAASSTT